MERRLTVDEYLRGAETLRPQELTYGILREPPAPCVHHQIVVGRIFARLDPHVRRQRAGRVVVSPVDVILDRPRALVVQPDIVFVSTARLEICRDRIWGARDLVVEVLSTTNQLHDRTIKLGWYKEYGVREAWVVDPIRRQIEICDLAANQTRVYGPDETLRSAVLPGLRLRPGDVCEE